MLLVIERNNRAFIRETFDDLASMPDDFKINRDVLKTNKNILNISSICKGPISNTRKIKRPFDINEKENEPFAVKKKKVELTPEKAGVNCNSANEPCTPTSNLKLLVCAASVLTPAVEKLKQSRDQDSCFLKEEKSKDLKDSEVDMLKTINTSKECTTISSSNFKDDSQSDLNILKDNAPVRDYIISAKTPIKLPCHIENEKHQENKTDVSSILLLNMNKKPLMGRKEKSLGLLCKRFLSLYPEYSENGTTIWLDDVTKLLGIGRRRVYDIVNVLESMEMIVRQGKNKYLWFGKSRLPATLRKLKALGLRVYGKELDLVSKRLGLDFNMSGRLEWKALQSGIVYCCFEKGETYKGKVLRHILPKPSEDPKERPSSNLTNDNSAPNPSTKLNEKLEQLVIPCQGEETSLEEKFVEPHEEAMIDEVTNSIMEGIITNDLAKKEPNRSLGILCQKFIMLFMVSKDKIVSLEKAARILIAESLDDGISKYKTKVRRLYDIANILTSIEFLEKCSTKDDPTRKASYKWIGVDPESLDSKEETYKAFRNQQITTTRHSLLSQFGCSDKGIARKLQCRSVSAHQLTSPSSNKKEKQSLPRTNSCNNAIDEDGFDIEQLDIELTGKNIDIVKEGGSPNQMIFEQKLKKLREEFPDKFSPNSLKMVLGGTEKCRLKSKQVQQSVDHSEGSMCKKIKTEVGHMLPGITINHITPKSTIESLKSDTVKEKNAQVGGQIEKILDLSQNIGTIKDQSKSESERFEDRANLNLHEDLKQPNKKRNAKFHCKRGKTKSKENSAPKKDSESYTYLTIPVTVKPLVSPLITVLPTSCHSNAISNVPMVLKIPVQIKTGVSAKTAAYSGQPLKANTNIQQGGTRELNSEQKKLYWSNNPAFVTPPHVTHLSELKPSAAPILFPRMTPETPSDSVVLPDSTTLHSVTRKLM